MLQDILGKVLYNNIMDLYSKQVYPNEKLKYCDIPKTFQSS